MSINVGILGFTHGHINMISDAWVKNPGLGVTVLKGWDLDKKLAEESCKNLNALTAKTIDEILNDNNIGAVVIAAATKYHAELCIKSAQAGKAIILYKPMALTLSEADSIVEAVEKYNVPFTMGYQMRVDPQNIKIKELINNKIIGDTYVYRRRHGLSTHLWQGFEDTWHVDPELNRDIFADDSSHPIDMLNWVFGVPTSVMCEMSSMSNPNNVPNDTGVALFKYSNGMIAEISCYFACTASEITTEVYGEKGSILQYYGDATSTGLPRPEGQPGLKWFLTGNDNWISSDIPSPQAHGERIAAQAKAFSEFIHGKRPSICSAREGRDSLRMVLACYVSAQNGERVFINDKRVYDI